MTRPAGNAWESTGADKVAPVPGALEALSERAQRGVTVVFNTNRSAANARRPPPRSIGRAGPGGARRDFVAEGRRRHGSARMAAAGTIAAKYCVIAMVGDQLGDFSDLFNARHSPSDAARGRGCSRWSRQYGAAAGSCCPTRSTDRRVAGGYRRYISRRDKRWTDPAGDSKMAQENMGWARDEMAARAAQRTAGRLLRQSRHRHPDAGREPYSRGDDSDAAVGERHARHRSVPVSRARKIPT